LIQYGHLVIALLILLERLALPVPVSPLLVVSGALAGMGRLSFPVILITATVASMAGDLFWYELGRHRGNRILSFLCRISLDPESCIRKAKGIFARIGTRSIVVARFIPGLSTFGPPLAGVFQMKRLHSVSYRTGQSHGREEFEDAEIPILRWKSEMHPGSSGAFHGTQTNRVDLRSRCLHRHQVSVSLPPV